MNYSTCVSNNSSCVTNNSCPPYTPEESAAHTTMVQPGLRNYLKILMPRKITSIYFLHIHIHIIQERVEYIHVKGPNEKGHVELAISKPKAGPAAVAAADSTMA